MPDLLDEFCMKSDGGEALPIHINQTNGHHGFAFAQQRAA